MDATLERPAIVAKVVKFLIAIDSVCLVGLPNRLQFEVRARELRQPVGNSQVEQPVGNSQAAFVGWLRRRR